MYINEKFKKGITSESPRVRIKITVDGEVIDIDDVISFNSELLTDTFIGSLSSVKGTLELMYEEEPISYIGKQFDIDFETYIDNEWVSIPHYKNLKVHEDGQVNDEMKKTITLTMYDAVSYKTDIQNKLLISENMTHEQVLSSVAAQAGIEVDPSSYNQLALKGMTVGRHNMSSDITIRELLNQLAQANLCIAFINRFGRLQLVNVFKGASVEEITQDDYSELGTSDETVPVNTILISRIATGDDTSFIDVVRQDEVLVERDGRSEIKIENNDFLYYNAEQTIDTLFAAVKGFKYKPFEAKIFARPDLDVGDLVTFIDINSKENITILSEHTIEYNGGLMQTINTKKLPASLTKYKYTGLFSKVQRLDIEVDKVKNKITLVGESVDELKESNSRIELELDKITSSVEGIHNHNIIFNFNGESDGGWTFKQKGLLPSSLLLPSQKLLPRSQNSPIFSSVLYPNATSEYGYYYFTQGEAVSDLAKVVVGGHEYSYRARRVEGTGRYQVFVREFSSRTSNFTETRLIDTIQPALFEESTIKLKEDTSYIALRIVAIDKNFGLVESMLNKGVPLPYFKSGEEAYQYAKSEIKVLANEISLKVDVDDYNSQIKLMGDSIESKVEKDKVVSTINQSAESVTINSNKINLNGATTINNKVVIDTEGKLHAEDGEFSGTIKSSNIVGTNVNGGNINVDTDIYVGNSIIMGNQSDTATKKIAFNNNTKIEMDNNRVSMQVGQLPYPTTLYVGDSNLFCNFADRRAMFSINGSIGTIKTANKETGLTFDSSSMFIENRNLITLQTGGNYLRVASGGLSSSGAISITSDKRSKENISDIDLTNAIDLIEIKSFNYIGNERTTLGVIAQDYLGTSIEKYLVTKYEDRYAVDYNAISMIGIYETKKLKEEVKELTEKVNEQATVIDELSNTVNELKQLIEEMRGVRDGDIT